MSHYVDLLGNEVPPSHARTANTSASGNAFASGPAGPLHVYHLQECEAGGWIITMGNGDRVACTSMEHVIDWLRDEAV